MIHIQPLSKLPYLSELKERLAKAEFTSDDVLTLILNLEDAHTQINTLSNQRDTLERVVSSIENVAWADVNDEIDIDGLRHILDGAMESFPNIAVSAGAAAETAKIQALLAQVLHSINVNGVITIDDKSIVDIQRYFKDRRLFR